MTKETVKIRILFKIDLKRIFLNVLNKLDTFSITRATTQKKYLEIIYQFLNFHNQYRQFYIYEIYRECHFDTQQYCKDVAKAVVTGYYCHPFDIQSSKISKITIAISQIYLKLLDILLISTINRNKTP